MVVHTYYYNASSQHGGHHWKPPHAHTPVPRTHAPDMLCSYQVMSIEARLKSEVCLPLTFTMSLLEVIVLQLFGK